LLHSLLNRKKKEERPGLSRKNNITITRKKRGGCGKPHLLSRERGEIVLKKGRQSTLQLEKQVGNKDLKGREGVSNKHQRVVL